MKLARRILVIRGGAIGDFVLTLPVFSALRRPFPEARIEILGYPRIAQLALSGGMADAVQSIETPDLAGFFACSGTLADKWADYFRGFDLIISFAHDPKRILQENIARCSGARFIAGTHRPDEKKSIHATEVFLKALEPLELGNPDSLPRLVLNSSVKATNDVAIHPGSGSEKKNWPEEKWSSFLQHLVKTTEQKFLLIGGEAEGERLHRLAKNLPKDRIRLARNLPLTELAEMISACALFVGHDSGITHLAAALGVPGLVLWSDTNELIWRPRNDKMRVLRSPDGLSHLSVEKVLSELKSFWRAS